MLSSRVAAGVIRAVYGGGGGGVDLVAAGAIPATLLRPSQARILLAALIGAERSRDQILSAFAAEPSRYVDADGSVPPEEVGSPSLSSPLGTTPVPVSAESHEDWKSHE